MDKIKTYHDIHKDDQVIHFGISRMEDIYDKRKGAPDHPHRHNYFTVVITKHAKGDHFIDFKKYPLASSQICFISPGQVHQIIEKEKSIGYALVFSNEFLAMNNIPFDFIQDLHLFSDFEQNPPLELSNEELTKMTLLAEEAYRIYNSQIHLKHEALGALLKLILILCNNLCAIGTNSERPTSKQNMLGQFKALVNTHYKTWHTAQEYAQELAISADHLNRIVKQQTGKTAKQHIQSRLIIAAKRLLYFSKLSNKEIGYELGFSEPANFSAFFKKCTGKTPSQFKSDAQ